MGLQSIMEMLGTAAFAISGALAALKKRLDIFGVLVLCFATAIGGGTIRDILIGNTPVAWLKDSLTINTILCSYLATLFLHRYVDRFPKTLALFDAVGLGFATVLGIQYGIQAGVSPAVCVTLGMVTGCFGGVMRDVLLNEIPLVFRKDVYASASLLGGATYFIMSEWDMFAPLSATLSVLVVVGIRIAALFGRWNLPGIGGNKPNQGTGEPPAPFDVR